MKQSFPVRVGEVKTLRTGRAGGRVKNFRTGGTTNLGGGCTFAGVALCDGRLPSAGGSDCSSTC